MSASVLPMPLVRGHELLREGEEGAQVCLNSWGCTGLPCFMAMHVEQLQLTVLGDWQQSKNHLSYLNYSNPFNRFSLNECSTLH